jgi:hypothetical protein
MRILVLGVSGMLETQSFEYLQVIRRSKFWRCT